MKALIVVAVVAAGISWSGGSYAQSASAVTATCKDGTTFSGPSKSGACRGHGGVKAFTNAATVPETTTPPAASTKPAPDTASHAGQVWVNTASKVYHCPGDKYFGKTKAGAYMSEAEAKSKGFHGVNKKSCGA